MPENENVLVRKQLVGAPHVRQAKPEDILERVLRLHGPVSSDADLYRAVLEKLTACGQRCVEKRTAVSIPMTSEQRNCLVSELSQLTLATQHYLQDLFGLMVVPQMQINMLVPEAPPGSIGIRIER